MPIKPTVIAMLLVPVAAYAQVFKCQEGGRTVYSQEPCSPRAEVIDATPATGGYDASAAADRRAQNARIGLQNNLTDLERDTNRRIGDLQRRSDQSSKQAKCDQLRSRKERAEYWSKEFKHPDNVNREQEAAKKAGSDLWWECR